MHELLKYAISFMNNIDSLRKELNEFTVKLKLTDLSLSLFTPVNYITYNKLTQLIMITVYILLLLSNLIKTYNLDFKWLYNI